MNYRNLLKLTVKLFLTTFLLLVFGFCFAKSIKAQEEPNGLRILYQGILSDSDGKPVEDGNYNLRFSIYDAETEGNIFWQEEYTFYNATLVREGKFRIILGRIKPINLNVNQGPFWLGISIGNPTEKGEIIWDIGIEPRKKIISLSELLKEEGLEYFGKDGLTEKEWEEIYQLLEKKLGEQPELVFLLDMEQLKTTEGGFSSQLLSILKNFINFISEKIFEIGNKISEIGGKIDEVLEKLEGITSALFNIGEKIDRLYQVLVVDKGLVSEQLPLESNDKNYTAQKFERLIIKEGENSIRVFNQSIKKDNLIFISFLDDPGSSWWISEKVPDYSFTISLKEPASQDLRFDYWILDEGEIQTINPEIEEPSGELPETKEEEKIQLPAQSPENNELASSTGETDEENSEIEEQPSGSVSSSEEQFQE